MRQEQKADDSPLHNAARFGNSNNVTDLLKAVANGKARADDGNTPFDLAKDNDKLDGTDAYRMLNGSLLTAALARGEFLKSPPRKKSTH